MDQDKKQNLNLELKDIVPEYNSKNFLVKWLFNRRLSVASSYLRNLHVERIIDLGCGDGSFLKLLKNGSHNLHKVWGVDLNSNVIQLKKEFPEYTIEKQNILDLKIDNSAFDVVVSLDTLEHIKAIDRAIYEIKRILSPGGYLILSMPVESVFYKSLRFLIKGTYSEESGPGAGVHYYNYKLLDEFVRNNGFKRQKITHIPVTSPFNLFEVVIYKKTQE